ncbi:MAG: FmdB family zinc ribbon protein [Syntrophomonadaceae bacterium]|jgi:putative FmdB family regulatory protein
MPIYEFKCKDCEHKFEVLTAMGQRDEVRCPGCQSSNLESLLSLFNTTGTGEKSRPEACQGCSNNYCSNFPR